VEQRGQKLWHHNLKPNAEDKNLTNRNKTTNPDMKKILTTISIVAMTAGAFAQGYVTFGNGAGTLYSTNGVAAGEAASTTAYYFDVLVSAWTGSVVSIADSSALGSWLDTGLLTVNKVNGQPGAITQLADVQANNWNIGVTNEFVIVGWSAGLGTNWTSALAAVTAGTSGWFGYSLPSFEASGAAPPGTPSTLLSGSLGPQPYGTPIATGINMTPVPEPVTLALAGLGGLSLLLLRRRK